MFIVIRPDIEWIVSPQILDEYKDVLSRKKFGLPCKIKSAWLDLLDKLTTVIDADIDISFQRDQKDAKFLSCAITAEADCFIAGDKNFKQIKRLFKTVIISVSQFKRLVCDAMPSEN